MSFWMLSSLNFANFNVVVGKEIWLIFDLTSNNYQGKSSYPYQNKVGVLCNIYKKKPAVKAHAHCPMTDCVQ